MKYKYLYQTSDNVVHEAWITARDRADAYTRLRKQHIRPMRVVGHDPIRWQPWAIGLAFITLVAIVVLLFFAKGEETEMSRMQLFGDRTVISVGMADNWAQLLPEKLDQYLAAYAQPGWIGLPPNVSDEEIGNFANVLAKPLSLAKAKNREERQIMMIVSRMRREFSEYLSSGGSAKDYLSFLEDRQNQERDFRRRAYEAVNRAPESMRATMRINMNIRLREMGLPEMTIEE